jgi:hypothetical protein
MAKGIPHGTTTGAGGSDVSGGIPRLPHALPVGGWTARRVITVVIGSVLALVSLGLLGGGGTLLWADQALRQDGYVTTRTAVYSTNGYALASERVSLGWGWLLTGLVGDIRLRVSAATPGKPVFVAVGPADRVAAYLSGSAYTTVSGAGSSGVVSQHGTARPALPQAARIWAAEAVGTGTLTLRWTPHAGDWMAVVMNRDASAGLTVRADAGVSAPGLSQVALELLVGGMLAGALSAALIWVPVRLAAGAG